MTPQLAPTPRMSEPARLAGVFLEPAKTFSDIAVRPSRWWVPMILLAITAVAFTYCYSQRVGWERMMRQTLESNTRMQSLPAEQREAAIVRGTKVAGVTGYVGAVLGAPVMMLIVAGVMMLVLNGLMGSQVSFVQSLSIVAYSFLTGVLALILSIVVMYMKSPEDFDIRNPLAFNGGAFLPATSPRWLVALASSFDLFTFWTLALMAVGYAAAGRRLAWSKALRALVMMWLLWVVVKTGWAAIMG